MSKKLEDIFDKCVSRMLQGESIESCLKDYPEEADGLKPLLQVAFTINKEASSLSSAPEFKARVLSQLQSAVSAKQRRPEKKVNFFGWQRRWALALTAVLVVLLTGAGTVAAASDSLPDETLYPVKLATERVRLTFALSDVSKAKLHTRLAERRAMEIAEMARQGKSDAIPELTQRLVKHLEKVSYAVESGEQVVDEGQLAVPKVVPSPAEVAAPGVKRGKGVRELKELLGESAPRSLTALENAYEQASQATKAALKYAIRESRRSYEKAMQETAPEPLEP